MACKAFNEFQQISCPSAKLCNGNEAAKSVTIPSHSRFPWAGVHVKGRRSMWREIAAATLTAGQKAEVESANYKMEQRDTERGNFGCSK